jgi:hypothetical protein
MSGTFSEDLRTYMTTSVDGATIFAVAVVSNDNSSTSSLLRLLVILRRIF